MKKHIFGLFLFFVLLFLSGTLRAQSPNNSIDTGFFMAVDAANYDSLLHNFYMQQYARTSNNNNRRASQYYAEFDNIPDSVFIQRLRNLHMVVPMSYNSDVRAYIKVYVRLMSHRIDAMKALSDYYFPMFEETLDRYNVPEELKYLTIVESALNPQATSRAGAAGLWQFMYSTGKTYDLEINSLIDERRDPYKSTVAAAKLLKALYNMYHDWHLAMAAYNCGPGNVNKAIARSGGKTSFWEIYPYLPRETRNYVPAYIGATYVMNYYHEHGITPNRVEMPLKVDTVHLRRDVHFKAVDSVVGIPASQLRDLNPQYRADIIPASSHSYAICIPSNKMSRFISLEDSVYAVSKRIIAKKTDIPVSNNTVVYHKVRKGETFNSIAQKYGVSVANLRRWNGKGRKSSLRVGQTLKIYLPMRADQNNANPPAGNTATPAPNKPAPNKPAVNKPAPNKPTPPKTQPAKTNQPVYYVVKNGDNLSSIAAKYHTTVNKIMKLNNMKSTVIRAGQKIRVK